MASEAKPKVIFMLGGPGAGKGTQCEIMTSKYGYEHYSTGDLLREFIKSDCEEAKKIRLLMSQGKLVPSSMIVEIVKKNIFKEGSNDKTYLIDGFPRSAENYQVWKEVIGNEVDVKTLIYLGCSLETLESRLLERAKTSGRSDDNIDTIRKRFAVYGEQTKPFLEYYEKNVGGVHLLSGEKSINEVQNQIKEILTLERLL